MYKVHIHTQLIPKGPHSYPADSQRSTFITADSDYISQLFVIQSYTVLYFVNMTQCWQDTAAS